MGRTLEPGGQEPTGKGRYFIQQSRLEDFLRMVAYETARCFREGQDVKPAGAVRPAGFGYPFCFSPHPTRNPRLIFPHGLLPTPHHARSSATVLRPPGRNGPICDRRRDLFSGLEVLSLFGSDDEHELYVPL